MAWVAEENFNSLSDGDLNGQGSGYGWAAAWSGDTDMDVQGTYTFEGAKAVKEAAAGFGGIVRQLTSTVTVGTVYCSMMLTTTSGNGSFILNSNSTTGEMYVKAENGNIAIYDNGTYINFGTYTANVWFTIGIDFDNVSQANKFRANVNNGAWTSWYTVDGGSYTNIGYVKLEGDSGGTADRYWDRISTSPYYPGINIDDSYSDAQDVTTDTLTFSKTCSGDNRILLVGIRTYKAGSAGQDDVITGVTYNGVSMTRVNDTYVTAGNNIRVYLYYLIAPATGANNVVVTQASGGGWSIRAIATSYTGAKQTGQPDASNTATTGAGTATSLSCAVTTVADNCWVVGIERSDEVSVAGTNTTFRAKTGDYCYMMDTNAPKTPAGSSSLQVTQNPSANLAICACSISPYVAYTPHLLSLTGVGI